MYFKTYSMVTKNNSERRKIKEIEQFGHTKIIGPGSWGDWVGPRSASEYLYLTRN